MYIDSHDITSIVVAILGGLFLLAGVVLAFVLPLLLSIRKHAKVAATETSNDHKTNMRVEGDERHKENTKAIAEVKRLVIANSRTSGRRFARIEDHLGIEHTLVPPPRRRKK